MGLKADGDPVLLPDHLRGNGMDLGVELARPVVPQALRGELLAVDQHVEDAVSAVAVSDRLYPQTSIDSNVACSVFEVDVHLGRTGLAEFELERQAGDPNRYHDPFVVGGGVGAIYAVTVVAIDAGRAVARTPFFLFKRTGVQTPDDLDSVVSRGTDVGGSDRIRQPVTQ